MKSKVRKRITAKKSRWISRDKPRRTPEIKPGVYMVVGTGKKVRIVVQPNSVQPYVSLIDSNKIPTKEVKPGIFELDYTPSERVQQAVTMIE